MSDTGDDVLDRLRQHRFFADLPDDLLATIAEHSEAFEQDADHMLLQQGEPADSFFAIEHGRVAIALHVPNKGMVTIETIQSGEIVGWSWLFPPYRWTFDAMIQTPVRGIRIDAAALRPILSADPQAGYALLSGVAGVMEDRLRSSRLRLLDLYGDHDDLD